VSGLPADEAEDDASAAFTVISGSPSPDELAAVTAVIQGLLDEQGENDARRAHAGPSAWSRSQKHLRHTLTPGFGAWRGFSA
jgi:hypothetical protein